MALQVQGYRAAPMAATGSLLQSSSSNLVLSTKQSMVGFTSDRAFMVSSSNSRRRVPVKVKSTMDTSASASAAAAVKTGQVTEVNKDTFWPIVNAAGDKIVVLDMYTQWCGPCKVIAPRFKELSEKHLDVVFLKLDCNQENKPLAKELGIKVVPTFKILKHSKVVKEVTGAKYDDLVAAIETASQV